MTDQVPDDDALLAFGYDEQYHDNRTQQPPDDGSEPDPNKTPSHHQHQPPSHQQTPTQSQSTPHHSPQHHRQSSTQFKSYLEMPPPNTSPMVQPPHTNVQSSSPAQHHQQSSQQHRQPPPPPPPTDAQPSSQQHSQHTQQQQQQQQQQQLPPLPLTNNPNLPPPSQPLPPHQYYQSNPSHMNRMVNDSLMQHHSQQPQPQPQPQPHPQHAQSVSPQHTNIHHHHQQGSPTMSASTSGGNPQPFSYVSQPASTAPVHSSTRSSRGPRRRRTSSKRSLEEMILESTIPTSITLGGPNMQQRNGPQIGLLTGVSSASGLMSPSLVAATSGPTLPLTLPEPPLATAIPVNPNAMQSDPQPRPKKKSKYSSEQDNVILQMKKEGKTWSEIAQAAKCGNALAARNRYQVLIGQQGGGAVVWDTEDAVSLKNLLEEGEKAKWEFIASELSRMRSKKVTSQNCQRKIKEVFDDDPTFFGVVVGGNQQQFQGQSYGFNMMQQHQQQQQGQQALPPPPPQPQLGVPPPQHQQHQPQQGHPGLDAMDPFNQYNDYMRR